MIEDRYAPRAPVHLIVINTNPRGGQTIYPLHMHILGGKMLRQPILPFLWGRLAHWGNPA